MPTPKAKAPIEGAYPTNSELAALRGWYAGLSARDSVSRYLKVQKKDGQSSRAMLTGIRKRLQAHARSRHREDLVRLLEHPACERLSRAADVLNNLEILRNLPPASPLLTDPVERWLPSRAVRALKEAGLPTLAEVAVVRGQSLRWWTTLPGLGATTARDIELLMSRVPLASRSEVAPASRGAPALFVDWSRRLPLELDGSYGALRAPAQECVLNARNDIDAVQSWLSLHSQSPNTRRAYQKEVERLLRWATQIQGKAISSLKLEDAVAYRAFLLGPVPGGAVEWGKFGGELQPRSAGYALQVVSSLFRWLVEQRYVVANPFAGVRVKGAKRAADIDASRALTAHEWALVRIEADMLDLKYGWKAEAAQRLRFLLDFGLATALRASELVSATLGDVQRNEGAESWLQVRGKGDKPAKVHLPPLAIKALERYLAQRGLPVTASHWDPKTRLLPALDDENLGLSTTRLRALSKRFFQLAAQALVEVNPALAAKLVQVSPHWIRHSHATQAVKAGVPLRVLRDNLRHADIATTSGYLNQDDEERASHLRRVFE